MDIVTGKKKPQVRNEDDDLQLLPEKRSKAPSRKAPKNVSNDLTRDNNNNNNSTTSDPGSLFRSLSFLIDDLKLLNYSVDTIEQVDSSSNNSFERAVHDLFINEDDDFDGDRH